MASVCSVCSTSVTDIIRYLLRAVQDTKRLSTRVFGSYQWTRLPVGLCTVGATFSPAIQLFVRGLPWEEIIVSLDDVIILGTDFEGTLSALCQVFTRFREHNLKQKQETLIFQRTRGVS